MPSHLTVGQLYHPARRSWPERVVYQCRSGQHELVFFLASPTPDEVEEIRTGPARFALLAVGSIIVMAFRFGQMPWSDSPYSWHLVIPEDERTLPPELPTPESRALVSVVLVDATTGLVRVLRAVTLSPAFTAALHDAIRRQAQRPFPGDAAYDRELAALYRRFPTSDSFAQSPAAILCLGGE